MKIIHCADLHLDSKMKTNLSSEKAKERKNELLNTFSRLADYAFANDVTAILIAGDLFDTKVISALTRNAVEKIIRCHPGIDFYYLKGNHDTDNFLCSMDEKPENLKLFGDAWTKYMLSENVVLYGAELSKDSVQALQVNFVPNPMPINIVMLHGQEAGSLSKDKAEIININLFRNKGIDYLALGHVHQYKCESLDARGKYCYPGCLEGRGFDECGEHGFVLLEIDEEQKTVKDTFVPFSFRNVYEINCDVTGLTNSPEICDAVREELAKSDADAKDFVKLVLRGEVCVDCEKDISFIEKSFENDYFCMKISDETKLSVDYSKFLLDESLKGEFVRMVMDSGMTEEEKADVIHIGLRALNGENILDEN